MVLVFFNLLLWFSSILLIIECIPLNYDDKRNKDDFLLNYNSEKLITFMRTFGYIDSTAQSADLKAEALYKEDFIIDGIKSIQKYGALQQTGILDENTIKLLSAPRCGVKDVNYSRSKRYIIGSKSWQKRKITYFIANWSPKVEEEKMIKWLAMAFNAWGIYSNLKFKRLFDPSADIIIAFGSGYHGDNYRFDGPGNILAHAFYPYEENAFGGDIHFDNDENWKENATDLSEGVDFLTVAVHELGHSLGLAHSPVFSSIMFPYYKGFTAPQLDYDDILALYQLYIQANLHDNSFDDDVIATEVTSDVSEEDVVSFTTETAQNKDEDGAEHKDENDTEEKEEKEKGKEEEEDEEGDEEDKGYETDNISNENEVSPNHESETATENSSISSTENNVPNLCDGNFDAVALLSNEIVIFKNRYVWKLSKNFIIEHGYPVKIKKMFSKLPKRFKTIDAAYQVPNNSEVAIFSGKEVIFYDRRGPIYNGPFSIERFTDDPSIDKIDSAMIWGKNNKTYLFSGDRFWRYNTESRKMEQYYPRKMTRWQGIPENIDAALSVHGGKTYFFKDKYFWIFNNHFVRAQRGYPKKVSSLFPHCQVWI